MNKNLYGLHLYGLQGNGAPDRLIELNDFKIIDDISYEKLLNKHLVFVFGTKDGNISRSLMRKKIVYKRCKDFTNEIMEIDDTEHHVNRKTSNDILEQYFKLIYS